MKNRITSAVAVYVVLMNDHDEVLLALRANTGYQDGVWQTPAGHVEMGELPIEATIRETLEEVGIRLTALDLKLVHVSARPKHDETGNRIDLFFHATHWAGEVANMEPHKCAELRWSKLSELPDNMTPHVRTGIMKGLNGELYSEFTLEQMKKLPIYGLV
ncbi:MAG: NUDIX domain-containing protein [Candidatus Paceibacterota bacterium]